MQDLISWFLYDERHWGECLKALIVRT